MDMNEMLEGITDGVFVWDRNWRSAFTNKAAQDIVQISSERLKSETFFELFPGIEKTSFFEKFERVMESRIPETVLDEFKHPDGRAGWYEVRVVPVEQGIVCFWRDITDRKNIEAEERGAKDFYQSTINALAEMVYVLDEDLRFLFVNDNFIERYGMFGLVPGSGSVIGKRLDEVLGFTGRETIASFKEIFKTGKSQMQQSVMKLGESIIYVESKRMPVLSGGRVTRVVSVVRDITESKLYEEKLERAEILYDSTINALEDWIGVIDKNMKFSLVNEALVEGVKKFGEARKTDGVVGQSFAEVMPSFGDDYLEDTKKVFFDGKTLRNERRFRIGEEDHFLESVLTPVLANEEVVRIVAVVRDITAKKKAERKNRDLQAQLFHTGKLAALGTLGAGIAHELNNPLAIIQGFAESTKLFLKKKDLVFEEVDSYVEKIVKQCRRMKYVVDHIREFSRDPEFDKRDHSDANQVINESLVLLSKPIENKNIKLELDLAEDLPRIQMNPVKLETVVQNLVMNAKDELEACEKEEKKIYIHTSFDEEKSEVKIIVKDSGRGMSPDIQDRVFEPFFTTKEVGRGTGLGLSLTYGVVTASKGKISLSSQEGEGASFEIRFPIENEE